jgi:hypothetical protein
MHDGEESREEWEQEILDAQHGVTFDEQLRRAQVITKKLSATPAPISDFHHLMMLLLSGVALAISFLIFSSDISHKSVFGLMSLVVSLFLGVAAFRRPSKLR